MLAQIGRVEVRRRLQRHRDDRFDVAAHAGRPARMEVHQLAEMALLVRLIAGGTVVILVMGCGCGGRCRRRRRMMHVRLVSELAGRRRGRGGRRHVRVRRHDNGQQAGLVGGGLMRGGHLVGGLRRERRRLVRLQRRGDGRGGGGRCRTGRGRSDDHLVGGCHGGLLLL